MDRVGQTLPVMHVVHVVVTNAFAGVERYLTYVAPELVARGMQVTVVGGDPVLMERALHGSGVHFVPGHSVWRAVRSLMQVRPRVVHCHMTAAEFAGTLARPWHRAPVVATRHFAAPRGSSKFGPIIRPLIRQAVAREIAISEFVAGAINEDADVIANGVPIAPHGGHDQRTVLVAQRLEAEKQTEMALRAWAAASLRDRGWTLMVAGRGACASSLQGLAGALGITNSVQFVGFRDDIEELLGSVRGVLAPAPLEPFGLTVVEAMARATPVIAARGGAHIETLGPEGWMFPPGDVRACAVALDRLAAGDGPTSAYGRYLRERQQRLFSLEAHVGQLLRLYESVVEDSARTSS